MPKEKRLFYASDDELRGCILEYTDIPSGLFHNDDGNNISHYDLLDALRESASHVKEEVFDCDRPGGSGHYYKAYVTNVPEFRRRLTEHVLPLLEKEKVRREANDKKISAIRALSAARSRAYRARKREDAAAKSRQMQIPLAPPGSG